MWLGLWDFSRSELFLLPAFVVSCGGTCPFISVIVACAVLLCRRMHAVSKEIQIEVHALNA